VQKSQLGHFGPIAQDPKMVPNTCTHIGP
jgi:hypothetical protein